MTWRAYSVDTITGAGKTILPDPASFSWQRALSSGASGQCTFSLDSMGLTVAEMKTLTAEWARTIVLEHDGDVVYAGIVRGRRYSGRSLTLSLVDLWGLWARRGAWDHGAPLVHVWDVTYSSASLGLLAKRAVQRGMSGSPPIERVLPITLPADVSGSLSRTYYGYHLEYVSDVLEDLMDEGLDIDFRPRWVGGLFDWHMRIDPAQTQREWHVNAPDGGVTDFTEATDGGRMSNNSYMVGEGSDSVMLYRSDRNVDSTLPLLDRVESRKNVSNTDQLAALVDRSLLQYEEATSDWSFEVLASGDPKVGELRLGDPVTLWFDGDPWIPDGKYERRIVRLSGGLGERVTVTCQPTGGA